MNEELKARIKARLAAESEKGKKLKLNKLTEQLVPLSKRIFAFSGSEYSPQILDLVKETLPRALNLSREVIEFIDDEKLKKDLESSKSVQDDFIKNPNYENFIILANLIKRISNYFANTKLNL